MRLRARVPRAIRLGLVAAAGRAPHVRAGAARAALSLRLLMMMMMLLLLVVVVVVMVVLLLLLLPPLLRRFLHAAACLPLGPGQSARPALSEERQRKAAKRGPQGSPRPWLLLLLPLLLLLARPSLPPPRRRGREGRPRRGWLRRGREQGRVFVS